MADAVMAWPQKTRDIKNSLTDSTRWNWFNLKAGLPGQIWKDALTAADLQRYQEVMNATLTPDCAHWLATGELAEVVRA